MINVHGCDVQWIDFPSGEPHCRVTPQKGRNHITVEFTWAGPLMSDQILQLMLLADALRGHGLTLYNIIFDYLPFARQDRRAVEGDAFALKVFANMVNSLKAEIVTLCDPHSIVAPALFDNVQVIDQVDLLKPFFEQRDADISAPDRQCYIVAPDNGAFKKAHDVSAAYKWSLGVIDCWKIRNPIDGEITGISVPKQAEPNAFDLVIVDDICDGGRTFIELAKALRSEGYKDNKIILLVSHGLFTKGFNVFNGFIDDIWVRGDNVWTAPLPAEYCWCGTLNCLKRHAL